MKKNKIINEGGVNGQGESLVNTNNQSFKELKNAILDHAKRHSDVEKMNTKNNITIVLKSQVSNSKR